MNTIQKNDIDNFVKSFHLGDVLEDKVVVITGATGLIGSCVVKSLLALRKKMRIILPVRNRKKALTLFVEDSSQLEIIECDLVLWFKMSCDKCDYIIHLASPTSGKYMIENPVETYMLAIDSTKAILDYAMKAGVKIAYVFAIAYDDYADQKQLEYNGKKYKIERIYRTSEYYIELSCSEVE